MNPLLKVAVLGAALSVGAGAGPAALAQSWTFGLFGDLAYQIVAANRRRISSLLVRVGLLEATCRVPADRP